MDQTLTVQKAQAIHHINGNLQPAQQGRTHCTVVFFLFLFFFFIPQLKVWVPLHWWGEIFKCVTTQWSLRNEMHTYTMGLGFCSLPKELRIAVARRIKVPTRPEGPVTHPNGKQGLLYLTPNRRIKALSAQLWHPWFQLQKLSLPPLPQ